LDGCCDERSLEKRNIKSLEEESDNAAAATIFIFFEGIADLLLLSETNTKTDYKNTTGSCKRISFFESFELCILVITRPTRLV